VSPYLILQSRCLFNMSILAQFLLRLTFGLAFGMAITSPRLVSSGFFRNHLYVTLGLSTLAALAVFQIRPILAVIVGVTLIASYAGSVCWLYEAKRVGRAFIWLVACSAFFAAILLQGVSTSTVANSPDLPALIKIPHVTSSLWEIASLATSGLTLGLTSTAMFLGHWYLNSPGMELAPLRRLLILSSIAVMLQAIISASGLVAMWPTGVDVPIHWVLLRWSFGIVGVGAMLWMAWQTLKIPNTQSATGILYVAVIGVFVGELAAILLSAESAFPL
jgi:hypothetical protein